MLGTHFDLKSEIARIAAKRAAELPPAPQPQAHSQFDDKLRDFLRSLGGDDWQADVSVIQRSTSSRTGRTA